MTDTGFTVIVAANDNGGIGLNGTLPWRLPRELTRFSKVTTGAGNNAVIMGRNTYESIPGPLKRRRNIVIASVDLAGATCVRDFDSAFDAALGAEHVFVIGGQRVYECALAHAGCTRILLTRVHDDSECDTFMPSIDMEIFTEVSRSEMQSEHGIDYEYIEYERKK